MTHRILHLVHSGINGPESFCGIPMGRGGEKRGVSHDNPLFEGQTVCPECRAISLRIHGRECWKTLYGIPTGAVCTGRPSVLEKLGYIST